jgi:hypothetical protein
VSTYLTTSQTLINKGQEGISVKFPTRKRKEEEAILTRIHASRGGGGSSGRKKKLFSLLFGNR